MVENRGRHGRVNIMDNCIPLEEAIKCPKDQKVTFRACVLQKGEKVSYIGADGKTKCYFTLQVAADKTIVGMRVYQLDKFDYFRINRCFLFADVSMPKINGSSIPLLSHTQSQL